MINRSEPVKNIEMVNKDKMTKSIHLSQNRDGSFEISVDTESLAPTSVRGVKSSLVRSKYADEDKALKAFDKKVNNAKKKGWKEKYKG